MVLEILDSPLGIIQTITSLTPSNLGVHDGLLLYSTGVFGSPSFFLYFLLVLYTFYDSNPLSQ